MVVLLQNLEAVGARDLPATIFDYCQYYGVRVGRDALATIWHVVASVGQLFALTKQGVREGRLLVDVLVIQRHM